MSDWFNFKCLFSRLFLSILNTNLSLSNLLVVVIISRTTKFFLIYSVIILNISFLKPPSNIISFLIISTGLIYSVKARGSKHSSNFLIYYFLINLSMVN